MNFKKLLLGFFVSLLVLSCKKETPQESTDNLFAFKEYISYTTSGINSVSSSIQVDLVKPLDDALIKNELSKDVIQISPKIDGELIQLNAHSIAFKPKTYNDTLSILR